jgi:general nucleoside transport system ATP-binding protein
MTQPGTEVDATSVPAVRFRGVTKRFGSIVACDAIDLDLTRGKIHGVLGENGAGKSTLMKILIGLVLPDGGSIELDGRRVQIADPLAAADLGIAMVHQHFSLIEALTVWENVSLGESGRLDPDAARHRVREIGERYGLAIDPDATVGSLSAGLRQRVEIIKCLRRDPSIVIFDEPTSVLTPLESEQLFEVLRLAVDQEAKTVALVSHKLDEVMRATDEVTILRRGRVIDSMTTAAADPPTLAKAMVGRPVSLRAEGAALGLIDEVRIASSDATTAPTVLEIRGVTLRSREGALLLDNLSLDVHRGEIVGVAGVEGNGQVALVDVLSSLAAVDAGTIAVVGETAVTGRAGAMNAAGVAVVPEDRHDSGCVMDLSVAENLALALPHGMARRGMLDRAAMRARAEELVARYQISCSSVDAPFWSLSGGNQQRVILARELSASPVVLVAAQPTRGLDVGAIEFVGERLAEAAAGGIGVLLISSELEELMHLASRIVVMARGRVVGEFGSGESIDFERLGLLMGGEAA